MTLVDSVLVAMFAASALLPIVGLLGLWREAKDLAQAVLKAAGDDPEQTSFGQFDVLIRHQTRRARHGVLSASLDLIWIGLGVAVGAAASIWSVVIAALAV